MNGLIRAVCYFLGVVTGAVVMAVMIPEPPRPPASQRYTLHITQTRAGHVSVDAGASFFLNDIDIDGFGLTSPGTEESDEVQIRIAAASEPGVVQTK